MEFSDYAILKLNEARIADAERAISRRRSRQRDDPAPARARDGRWAAAIHRLANSPVAPERSAPPAAATGRTSTGQATLGCAPA
ncbi:hypothetical protein [Glaciibacter superstes]|uniref:hypothetical protein n=1 Tax=Glaciibacter superstes TaxID=501023 RepID=UPI0003B3B8D2|nr:hypothetical protein [Glaciibacter superstes]